MILCTVCNRKHIDMGYDGIVCRKCRESCVETGSAQGALMRAAQIARWSTSTHRRERITRAFQAIQCWALILAARNSQQEARSP
jgi:hypothetical protein